MSKTELCDLIEQIELALATLSLSLKKVRTEIEKEEKNGD